jgi:hypothetical protein
MFSMRAQPVQEGTTLDVRFDTLRMVVVPSAAPPP